MKFRTFTLFAFLSIGMLPAATDASTFKDIDNLYEEDVYLKKEVSNFSTLFNGGVLGESTDGSTVVPKVTKKLDTIETSYFRDIKIKPPKGWYLTDEYGEAGDLETYIVNEEMTSQVAIFRVRDEESTLSELTNELEDVCELCGYKVLKKGTVKIGSHKGKSLEVLSPDVHFLFYVLKIKDIAYLIQLSAPADEWKLYKPILTKSAATLKINVKNLLEEES